MPSVKISKIKVRRGSNDQRKFVVFDQGELVYTVDTKRLFVGTGTLNGEQVVGSKTHPPLTNYTLLSTVNAEIGDLVHVSSKTYQLTANNYTNINSWADVSAKFVGDPTQFTYTGDTFSIKDGGINEQKINSSSLGLGLSGGSGNKIALNTNSSQFEYVGGKLNIKDGGINEQKINSSSLGLGLSGGSGNKITLNTNPSQFNYTNNQLNINNFSFDQLNSSWFGNGLKYDNLNNSISVELSDAVAVDDVTITRDSSNNLTLKPNYNPSTSSPFTIFDQNEFGIGVNKRSSIGSVLSAYDSRIFDQNETILGKSVDHMGNSIGVYTTPMGRVEWDTNNQKTGEFINLKSAGFITVEESITTSDGSVLPRFAIPIFRF